MPYSTGYFKKETVKYIKSIYSTSINILDIGAGCGTYFDLLSKEGYTNLDCVEVFEDYVERFGLRNKYKNVIIGDITKLDISFEDYDLIILGDVLEHIAVEDAQSLLKKLKYKNVIVAVPFLSPQGESEGNKHEIHLQEDLTLENFLERYDNFIPYCLRYDYGIFVKNSSKILYTESQEREVPISFINLVNNRFPSLQIKDLSDDVPKHKKITIVTGMWDMGRGEIEGSFKRTYKQYLDRFEELLRADCYLYVYCDPKDVDFVKSRRDDSNTYIHPMSLEQIEEWFEFTSTVDEIRSDENWLNQAAWLKESPQATLKYYNPVVMSKMFMLNNASIYNPFGSTHFFWIDGGITSTVHPGYFSHDKVFQNLSNYCEDTNDFIFLSYPYIGGEEIHGFPRDKMAEYCNTDYVKYVCRGGFFGGKKNRLNEINGIYYNYLKSSLVSKLMGTEESIFTIIAHNHKQYVHRFEIEDNGLVWPFFEKLKEYKAPKNSKEVALYVITYNSPRQFETLLKSMELYDNEFLSKTKKYLLNNSLDRSTDEHYQQLCLNYGFEEIKKDNLGICGGRQFIAEHFTTTGCNFYMFFEDDMNFYVGKDAVCRNGFRRHIDKLLRKVVSIMKKEKFDFLKFNFSEFFGDNSTQWSWYNVPQDVREATWPDNCKLPEIGLSPNAPRTNFGEIKSHEGLAYSSGEIYYCNWPQIVSVEGNQKMFLDTKWTFPYEQTWMSFMFQETKKGNLKPALLLATPTEHERFDYYPGEERREN